MASLYSLLALSWVFEAFSIAALLATLAVAGGLYLEYERHEDKRKRLGEMLVRGGVALEALFGLIAFTSATIRESKSEEQIASLTLRASQLEKDTATARAQIALSNEHVASAERDAATANERAETARLETAKIEKEYGPRQLSQAQLASLAKKAKAFSGMTIEFAVHTNDTESANFGLQIGNTLKSVGWTATFNIFEQIGSISVGLELTIGNDEESAGAAQMLKAELGNAGFSVAKTSSIGVAKHVELLINPRPLPSFGGS
jgi:hypothetical protein